MPRPPRLHVKGALYYVTQQGAHDQALFRTEADTEYFLDLLRQYKTKHGFHLYAYSLLSEKIALLVEPLSEITISEIMRDLTSRYSKYYNSQYGGNGPLFKGRFRTSIAEKKESLGLLVRFLHSQPALAMTAGSANAVWASSLDLFSPQADAKVLGMKEAMCSEMNELEADLRERGLHSELVSEFMNASELSHLESQLSKPFMGSPAFVRRVQEELSESAAPKVEAETVVSAASAVKTAAAFPVWGMALTFAVVAAGGFSLAQNGAVFFKSFTQQIPAAASAVKAPETAAPQAAAKVTAAAPAERVVLDGSAWDVRIIPMNKSEKTAIENDSLVFSQNKVASRIFGDKGFNPTNYNLSVNPEGIITWETMQRSASGEVVSWRGEWNGKEMKGVISSRFADGDVKNAYFTGIMAGGSAS